MLEENLEAIKKRNARVESNKAWEISWTRRLCIAVATYWIAVLYMQIVGLSHPFWGAFVPSGGYLLSTMSLLFIKNYWLKNIYQNQES